MLIRRGVAPVLTALLFVSLGFISIAQAQPPADNGTAPRIPLRERLAARAAKGDAEAQFDLAKMYETGRGGLTKDFTVAEHWYRESANQGDPFAQASLAILYRFGKGVPQDLVQAYMWFSLAASHTEGGDRESIAEMRDATAAKLTPAQLNEAQRLIREWKPKPASQATN
jgi:TPR repeat protein